ncbi:ankyrin repeat-containing protein [Cucumis melo var. makuwa]|uniref:Ankyrin repeat-containing protein n=1 Tax=Cucumis melo var. makuwa TaxID=1194695 RepID=A0A5D3BLW8_CUCMM|nr:ankyrin repeat-containing protein [Cucumis melo var. makuwa]
MASSVQTSHSEDDDISSESSGEEEQTTPLSAQRPNAPPADAYVVDISDEKGDEEGDGEEEEEGEDENGEEQENEDEEEESNNNSIPRSSMEGSRSSTGAPTQDPTDNTTDPRTTKKKGLLPVQVVLYQAAIKGDWKTAKSIFDVDSSAITMKITDGEDTPLHIAAAARHISFVENLVGKYSSDNLAIKNSNGDTALAFAAASGVVRIAKVMVDKNEKLPNLYNNSKQFPVLMAVAYKRKEMASFLLSKTDFQTLDEFEQIELLISAISSDYYDIALDILTKKPELAKARMGLRDANGNWRENSEGETALHVLSRKSDVVIGSSSKLSFWRRHMNSRFKRFYKKAHMKTLAHQTVERIWNFVVKNLSKTDLYLFIKTPSRLLHNAASAGNAEFLIILISSYPELIWKVDDDDKSIFHVAVENRQESVFSLIYEIGGLRDFLANYYDHKKNSNMLHLAGKLAAPYHLSRVSGAALQMQRELLWFTEVEKFVVSSYLQMKTKIPLPPQAPGIDENRFEELTPRELFTKEHKSLLKDGEEWMKNTANSCMLVATLIATVVFAAAFTVPGGNDDKSGTPNFRQNQAFTVFVITDVAALVFSTTSILTFLSILTSRYAEDDFLMSLPIKLLFGLVTLFLSISCMVVAFSATFFIAYDKTKQNIPLAIAIVSIVPVVCFCLFHSKLVVDIFRSGYWAQFSLKKHKKRLF